MHSHSQIIQINKIPLSHIMMLQITTYSTLLNYCISTTINSSKLTTQSLPHRYNAIRLSWNWCYSLWTSCNFPKSPPKLPATSLTWSRSPRNALKSSPTLHNRPYTLDNVNKSSFIVHKLPKSSPNHWNWPKIFSESPLRRCKCPEIALNRHKWSQNFAEPSRINWNSTRDIIACLIHPLFTPELTSIVTNGHELSPKSSKMSPYSHLRHHRMSQPTLSCLANTYNTL